jgi:hypothetical protein
MEIEIKVEPLDEIKIGVQSPSIGVPKGGTTGQVLSKNSDADYDTEWEDVESAAIPDNSIAKAKLVLAVRQSLDKADTSVQQVTGKGLSDENYSLIEKQKLAGIEPGAEVNAVDSVNGQTGVVTISVFSGDYNDLSNKPTLGALAPLDTVSTAEIDDNAVTFAKLQEIGSQKLIGRSASGNGDAGQIGVDGGLEFQGSNIRRAALTGAVTASAGSNTTSLGSFTKAQLDTAVSDASLLAETVTATGAVIDFTASKVFNSPASPSTANITDNLTGAKIGIVQKIYHNHSVAPTVPAGWVLLGSGTYTISTLNIIFAEWVSSTRVEYWIVQPA